MGATKKEEKRIPPPPEAWEHAATLTPVACTEQPALISDGGGLPFAPEQPFEPFEPLDPDDPAVAALIAQIDRSRQQSQRRGLLGLGRRTATPAAPAPTSDTEKLAGWRALAGTDDEILYARGRPPQLLTVAVQRTRRGRWEPVGVSNSRPLRASREGVRASSWRLDPSFELTPQSTELHILVTEQTLASGALASDRLLTPELHLGAQDVILRVYVKPFEGDVGRARRYETPVIIALPEPLGSRLPVDGALWSAAGQRTGS